MLVTLVDASGWRRMPCEPFMKLSVTYLGGEGTAPHVSIEGQIYHQRKNVFGQLLDYTIQFHFNLVHHNI